MQILISEGILSKMRGFAQPETSQDGKPDLCYHGKVFLTPVSEPQHDEQ